MAVQAARRASRGCVDMGAGAVLAGDGLGL